MNLVILINASLGSFILQNIDIVRLIKTWVKSCLFKNNWRTCNNNNNKKVIGCSNIQLGVIIVPSS